MRTLGIAVLIIWSTIGLDLFMFPDTELELEVKITKQLLGELEDSPLLAIPDIKSRVDKSKRLLHDPTTRRIVIWIKWSALLFLIMLGMWSAYAIIRQRSNAMILALTSALLFLGREAIFHRESYALLHHDTNIISWYLDNGYYLSAISSLWYHRFLPAFFLLLTMSSCIYLARERLRKSQLTSV